MACLTGCSNNSLRSDNNPYPKALDPQAFQKVIEGKKTKLYTLKNNKGMRVSFTNYGARVVSILAPDRKGQFCDVVTGFPTLDEYISCPEPFHGPIVGPVGNRIASGKFNIDGVTYQLPINNGVNHLHGGPKGFHHQAWDVVDVGDQFIHLHILSKDGELGYPGNLHVDLRYELSHKNEIILSYRARTDKKTVVNLTWHPFFNLAGEGNTINDHRLMINADRFTPVDKTLIPLGRHDSVTGTPFDFRTAKAIGRDLHKQKDCIQLQHGAGYDHNWVLNNSKGKGLNLAARVEEPTSGRALEVYTQEPGLQFYGGNFFDGKTKGKNGQAHIYRGAMALETQQFPDSINQKGFSDIILNPGEEYKTQSIYAFSTIS
ncbi:MAG: galactose mutarotase [Planctomycetes bacterium]|nr:galactose mutarotase [Planctomycetota bacterium]